MKELRSDLLIKLLGVVNTRTIHISAGDVLQMVPLYVLKYIDIEVKLLVRSLPQGQLIPSFVCTSFKGRREWGYTPATPTLGNTCLKNTFEGVCGVGLLLCGSLWSKITH